MNIQVHVVPRTVSEQGIQFPEPVVDQQVQTSLVFKSPPKDAVPKSCISTQTEGDWLFMTRQKKKKTEGDVFNEYTRKSFL